MTDLAWTMEAIAQAVGGTVEGGSGAVIAGVTTDSRSVASGDLFVPVVGEHFDGHDFIEAAFAAGAAATIAEPGRTEAVPRIEVTDTAEALVDLAALRRSELDIPVIAITGSTGKTSTKDLLKAGIRGSWASPRSYNNEVGVPLTVLATPAEARALIVEVGSRGVGHIQWLARCVRPDVSIVTNLGVVHLETFGSEDGLADAKYELIDLLDAEGVAVIPADESRLMRDPDVHTVTFGQTSDADVQYVVEASNGSPYPTVALTADGVTRRVTLSMAGAHQAANAAAAFTAARAIHRDLDEFVAQMGEATGSDWRMDVHAGRYTVINDAYNANPQSVEAALRTLAAMDGRSIAVLGPMAELGAVCEREHRRMGALAVELGISELIVVGADHGYALGAGDLARNVTDSEQAADTLAQTVRDDDVVLVKASRSAALEQLAIRLIKEAST